MREQSSDWHTEYKRELDLIADEYCRDIYNDVFIAYKAEVNLKLGLGLITQEYADEEIVDAEDYFLGIPEAMYRLKTQKDEDGWLSNWLTRHPEYLTDAREPLEWPEWLPKPEDKK